jgi:hypothetical protein
MGTLVRFPEGMRVARSSGAATPKANSATVIILPVIRIERYEDEPMLRDSNRSQRRRRRRVSRT